MTETTRRGTTAPDDATEQLRVTGSRLPGPLDPATPPPATEVLSIHDLLDGPPEPALTPLPPEPVAVAVPAPVSAAPVAEPVAVPRPAPVAVPAAPARAAARPARQRSEVADRVRSDAAAAWDGARREVAAWLGRADNALIVGTVVVALLLLVVIATVG